MDSSEQYRSMLDEIDLENVEPMGFLLRKMRGTLRSYSMGRINTDYFEQKLKLELQTIRNKYDSGKIKIKDTYADVDDDDVVVLDANEYQAVQSTIKRIFQYTEADPADKQKGVRGAKASAMLFKRPNSKSIIAIDLVSVIYNKGSEKRVFVTYDDMRINEFQDKAILLFKYGLPCIYYEEYNALMVLNRKKTEDIFNLREHYQNVSKSKFDELIEAGIVEIQNDVLDTELGNNTTARKIYAMVKDGNFARDINYYKKYVDQSADIEDERAHIKIRDNKVIISNQKELLAFLYVTRDDVVSSIINPDNKYVTHRKDHLRSKRKVDGESKT